MALASSTTCLLAPLAGYTDLPFRRMCWKQGLDRGYTALIDAGALVYGNDENRTILMRGSEEPWVGVQLMGSRLDLLSKAAAMLDSLDFNEIDFNMGCPVRKVLQRQSGAALLKDPEHALDCVRLLRSIVSRPLTVKLRILDEQNPTPTVDFCRRLEDCGVSSLTIHGRLTSRIYSGPVAMDVIRAVREHLSIPVTANGGIFGIRSACALAEGTGCQRLMVARGAIGNPWIFRSLKTGSEYIPTHLEVCEAIEEHITGMSEIYGVEGAMISGRKIILAYMRGRGYHRSLKANLSQMNTWEGFQEFMRSLRDDRDFNHPSPVSGEASLQDVEGKQ